MHMKRDISNIIRHIGRNENEIGSKQASIGFDGFIDNLVRVIKAKGAGGVDYFQSIGEFGSYLAGKQNMSCSIELKGITKKIGGNMPILTNALGNLGVSVNCLGAMGASGPDPVFRKMHKNCTLHSFADPGYTMALEFNDGKIMLALMEPVDSITWDTIKNSMGLENIVGMFQKSDCLGMVNWSEVKNSSQIWECILEEIIPYHKPNKKQIMLFDLSDCSRRSREDIIHALNLIQSFTPHYKVILSLNENEARLLCRAMDNTEKGLDEIGGRINSTIDIDCLVIHATTYATAWDSIGQHRVGTLYTKTPKISTGGGDNFNAGLCFGQLLGCDTETSLLLANMAASFYVHNGFSPDALQLKEFLERHGPEIL